MEIINYISLLLSIIALSLFVFSGLRLSGRLIYIAYPVHFKYFLTYTSYSTCTEQNHAESNEASITYVFDYNTTSNM